MRRYLKLVVAAIFLLAMVPVISLGVFDLLVFQPLASKVHTVVSQSAPSEQAPPPSLVSVIRVARINVSAHAARLLMREVLANPSNGGMLGWHLTSAAWQACISLHLSEQEQLAAFLSLSAMGAEAHGFAASSEAILGVPLANISVEQAATLLTVAKSPTTYLANPERLARDSATLSQRVRREL